MSEVRDRRVELILQQLQQLPTLPSVAVRVLEVTTSDSSSAQEVVKLISSDPSLSARILQLVHRSDSGVRGEVTTLERAVIDALRPRSAGRYGSISTIRLSPESVTA